MRRRVSSRALATAARDRPPSSAAGPILQAALLASTTRSRRPLRASPSIGLGHPRLVHVGGVEEVDAVVHACVHQARGGRLVAGFAEGHGAKTGAGNREVSVQEGALFHETDSLTNGCRGAAFPGCRGLGQQGLDHRDFTHIRRNCRYLHLFILNIDSTMCNTSTQVPNWTMPPSFDCGLRDFANRVPRACAPASRLTRRFSRGNHSTTDRTGNRPRCRPQPLVARRRRPIDEPGPGHALRLERLCGAARKAIRVEAGRHLHGFHHRGGGLRAHLCGGRTHPGQNRSALLLADGGPAGEPGILPVLLHHQPHLAVRLLRSDRRPGQRLRLRYARSP